MLQATVDAIDRLFKPVSSLSDPVKSLEIANKNGIFTSHDLPIKPSEALSR